MAKAINFVAISQRLCFFDNIIDFLGSRFYCNFMAIVKVFVATLRQIHGKTSDFIAILWQKQSILLRFHGVFRAKKNKNRF